MGWDFYETYACVGLWCQFFLIVYSFTELSNVMRYATRSTEEIFSLFICVAFIVEAFKAMKQSELSRVNERKLRRNSLSDYQEYYNHPNSTCNLTNAADIVRRHLPLPLNGTSYALTNDATLNNGTNSTPASFQQLIVDLKHSECRRDTSILYVLLMFGTLWLGLFLYNFRKTPYLTRGRREILADYALPVSVVVMSLVSALMFKQVHCELKEA